MKRFYIKYLLLLLMIGGAFAGCKKGFLDVNEDPNRVTDANVTAALLFTRAAVGVGDQVVGGNAAAAGARLPLQFAQDWVGYMAPNGDFARDETETTYNLDFGFGNRLWQDYFDVLFDLHLSKVKGLEEGDTVLAGAAMVLTAKLYQEVVDLYGDVPYSQAFQSVEYPHPAYDKAEDVYTGLQASLDTAVMYLKYTAPSEFETADIINDGHTDMWIKFANTLKLRMLIRQSEVAGFNPAAEVAKITANGGVLGAGETISVNPGYADELNKQSPFYANYGYTPSGTIASSSFNANGYIVNILESNNDPRLDRFFAPIDDAGTFVGAAYGDLPGNLPAGNETSYFGPAVLSDPTQDQWIMTSFESLFLHAEAVARGWMPGDAAQAYTDAVTESFTWLKVSDPASAAAAYMNGSTIANWGNAGTSPAAQAKFIAFQKYIANTCTDPLESYADQRRLNILPSGYLSVNTGRTSSTLPVRLLYPQSEYTTNGENVRSVGNIDAFTSKLFWEP